MKKLSLLILIALLVGRVAMAVTYSGTVTNAPTGAPVAGQMVYLCDTSGHPKDSMLTSSSGGYYFTPGFMPAMGFQVYVTACGVTQHSGLYPMNMLGGTWNVAICGTPLHLYGGVYGYSATGGYQFANAKVYLIAVTAINLATGDTTLTAVDSLVTNSQGIFDTTYAALPTQWFTYGLRLKAALSPSDPQYANFLPSYFGGQGLASSLSWRGALLITPTIHEVDIEVINGVNPGGPAFIGGSVLLGANKSAAVGDPLSKRILILTKASGEAVAYIYSDASGHFSFPSVPLGAYKLFGDALGKSNPALSLTLASGNSSINNVIFEENSNSFVGHVGNLAVSSHSLTERISVFPNPIHDLVNINGLASISGDNTIVLRNMTGAEIARQSISNGDAQINTSTLPAGIYLLQVKTSEGTATFSVTK